MNDFGNYPRRTIVAVWSRIGGDVAWWAAYLGFSVLCVTVMLAYGSFH